MSKRKPVKEKSHVFEGRILEFEKMMIDYHVSMAIFNSESSKIALMRGYLSIHGILTQRQLKDLTGFSISTISTNLTNLVNVGYLKRKMISGTHEYVYFPGPLSEDSISQALGSLKSEIKFLKIKIKELEQMNDPNKKGYTLLLGRLNEIVSTFLFYHELIDELQNPGTNRDIETVKEPIEPLTLEDFAFLEEEFDPEIKAIEDDFIDFFTHESAYIILKTFPLLFYMYFMTRKVLTQKKLRDLTGLSLGKVSQVLRGLLEKKMIEKVDKSELKMILPKNKALKIHYGIKSFKKSFMKSGLISLLEIIKWEDKFESIKVELETDKQKLKNLNGYEEVSKSVNEFLDLLQLYKKTYDFFSKF